MNREYFCLEQQIKQDDINNMAFSWKKLEEAKRARDNATKQKAESDLQFLSKKITITCPEVPFYYCKAVEARYEEHIRSAWTKNQPQKHFGDLMELLGLNNFNPIVDSFPEGSWFISVNFELLQPYLSGDDQEMYIIDNPVRKEWVFKVPYIAPSQWKGMLRSVMTQLLVEEESEPLEFADRRFRLSLLFGDEKGELDDDSSSLANFLNQAGRSEATNAYREKIRTFFQTKKEEEILPSHMGYLHFYPSYFDKKSLEIINPHSRSTGAGSNPIWLETIPAGQRADFYLLYVPGYSQQGKADIVRTSLQDLQMISCGLKNLFTDFGIGGKTSSGFGKVGLVDQIKLRVAGSGIQDSLEQYTKQEKPEAAKRQDSAQPADANQEVDRKDQKGIKGKKKVKERKYWREALSEIKEELTQTVPLPEVRQNLNNQIVTEGSRHDEVSWSGMDEMIKTLAKVLTDNSSKGGM